MRSFFVALMSLIICQVTFSQENPGQPEYALSFGIADNFSLEKFNMDIAVKKIFDDSNQLRLFLSPRITSADQDEENNGGIQNSETKSFFYSLGIGADYLWTIMTNDDVSMFCGPGLVFSYGKRDEESSALLDNGDKASGERNASLVNAGIRGSLGVEWRVNGKIGIHSEYLLTGTYEQEKADFRSTLNGVSEPTAERTISRIILTTNILFGISIYL